MSSPKIKAYKRFIPMIYAYTTPNDISHNGWSKIGYTAYQSVEDRINQQSHTVDVKTELLWQANARYNDGTDETFTDHEFHDYLVQKRNVERKNHTEWFHIDKDTSRRYFYEFAARDYENIQGDKSHIQYELRKEQKSAVDKTISYFKKNGKGSEFLWNAKPRFGKTLTAYDLIRKMQMKNVLVVTNRPSIANSWFDDFDKFIACQSNLKFVSETDALKDRPVLSRQEFINLISDGNDYGQIVFESLQGLKGSVYFGGNYDKLKWIKDLNWDLLIIDEAHEGVDTYKTSNAFDNIKRKYTLHLTGTPFKALANGKFAENQIFNWSYADEQKAKADWNEEVEGDSNPYSMMPRLNMFTYQLSKMLSNTLKKGIDVGNEDRVNPAFDLNEFFKVENGKFKYDHEIDCFLKMLTTGEKYPFSTPKLRRELSHTFWILNRVDSAKELAKKLQDHPVFKEYKVILAVGNGKFDDNQLNDDQLDSANEKAFDKVQKAIKENDKTITLSVGQLTTGVTVKPWSAVLMLSNMHSPAEYMQAAFRAQNPYTARLENGELFQKENAYVFDFDPTRTLTIFDEFANDLMAKTSNGKGTIADHKNNISKLLNFFPVIGEDKNGKMVELDEEQVLSIPRQLKSQEVVNRGFMSNFLFANISRIFAAPTEVREILNELVTIKEGKIQRNDHDAIENAEDVSVDNNGEIEIPKELVIGKYKDLFGDKVYSDLGDQLISSVNNNDSTDFKTVVNDISKQINDTLGKEVINRVSNNSELNKNEVKRQQKHVIKENNQELNKIAEESNNQNEIAKTEYKKALSTDLNQKELNEAKNKYETTFQNILDNFNQKIHDHVKNAVEEIPVKVVERVEKNEEKKKLNNIEEDARSHLRGFSRTIPSFIMAYGDKNLTLQNFDDYTEDDVFKEVTGITENQFRFLRDGGDYVDSGTGENKHFEGHLFDEVVFNDSIQQFLEKKNQLSNYFEDNSNEDIFDYIPSQKNNQIFTPKAVVKHMVDDLEKNNPGIFDDPNKTFADLYMKSGLYITEIIKRLFRNNKMKQLFPDKNERIKHIVENQVYGLAPTRIIYLIAINYIFGFDENLKNSIGQNHFKQVDAAKYAKEGTLKEIVEKEFGNG
ncbi:DEAD/DEAH box helicase family protein [Fructilactobacillus cliffordii]|uniref:DEAD/DEAH box helicase n=1 Tax=Fructilactobacillus cliffordii TaxID=2940299 RepID=UPI0020927DE7|nr:DEAD/DEAH box helicase family protein [Fructilactobacillus cliffordii]USS86311.1 DEAD/DEAH box helicase family protein [Fructilactobacillus cliffordii]